MPALKRSAIGHRSEHDDSSDVAVASAPPPKRNGSDVGIEISDEAGPLDDAWADVLESVKHDKIQVWSLLHHARPESYRDEAGIIAVPNDFHRRVLSSQEEYLLSQIRAVIRVPLTSLQFTVHEDIETDGLEETAPEFDPYELMQRKRQENPVVRAIFDQFGGELVW